jgi:hypothetical protein
LHTELQRQGEAATTPRARGGEHGPPRGGRCGI